jgi:putative peptidoglycan lipid II flippase
VQLLSRLYSARAGALVSSLIVMGGFVLSRITGLLRDVVISARFGTSAEYGAYLAAFRITDLLYIVIIGGALGSSFIPVFIQVWERDGQERAWRLASALLSWTMLLLALASLVLWLIAPAAARWAYGTESFSPELLELTIGLTRLFLLSPLLLGLGGLAMAALNARERFTLPALAPTLYNLGIMLGALLLAPTLGIWGLAWGVVIGSLLYLLFQIPGLLQIGMRLRLELGRGISELGTVARQMGPRVLGQSAAHLSTIITAALAARLERGPELLAGLGYAFQIMLLPYGIFSLSLSTVAYPTLARLNAEQRLDELRELVRRTLGIILFLTVPAAIALIMLGLPIIRLLLQRGAFDDSSLRDTSAALLGYAAALPAFAASEILIRSFYAMQRTWLPVLVGLLQVGLNLVLGIWLSASGIAGLALAFSIANNLEALLLCLLLPRILPGIWRDRQLWRSLATTVCLSLIMGGALFLVQRSPLGSFSFLGLGEPYLWQRDIVPLALWLLGVSLGGAALYLGLSLALGAREPRALLARLRRTAR